MVEWIWFTAGIVMVAATAGSLTRSLIVPRAERSRLFSIVEGSIRAIFVLISRPFDSFKTKDRVLGYQAPATLLVMLTIWLAAFFVGFALVLWPLTTSLPDAFRESGSSMLTLGTHASGTGAALAVNYLAAVTGLVTVALQIAYLPTLYGAFNRREMLVTTLQSRAGVPAWGPEILARHQMNGLTENLGDFYVEWERWAADVAETHSNYPILVSFRSPHPLRSWILGLLAVLDSAALYNSLCPSTSPMQARLCIRMGFTALRDIAAAIDIPFDPDPIPTQPIELPFDEFLAGLSRLQEVGFPMERDANEAWEHFRGWRVNYESIAYAIADRVVAAPGLWSGMRAVVPRVVIPPLRPIDRRPDRQDTLDAPPVDSDWRL